MSSFVEFMKDCFGHPASASALAIYEALSRSMAMIEFDTDGHVLQVNDNFLAVVGYTREEVVGKHHRMFCGRSYADTEEYRSFWARLHKGLFQSGQFMRKNRAGDTLWLEASYSPVIDSRGQVIKIVKVASNVTDKVQESLTKEGWSRRSQDPWRSLSLT